MSEKLPQNSNEKHESSTESHPIHSQEVQKSKAEKLNEHAEKPKQDIEQIRDTATAEAKGSQQLLQELNQSSTNQEEEPVLVNSQLKEIAYQRVLKRTRRHLSPYSRSMSKIIHQPTIDAVSEGIGKTIGRPSGIIGGGLLALVGTSIYYYLARHYGYSYNSFVFLLLMFVGFAIGWIAEILYKILMSSKK